MLPLRKCAFLTMDDLTGFVFDDHLAEQSLRELGWEVEYVAWSDPTAEWNKYEIVIPRTTWDYHRRVDEFLSVLGTVERSSAHLANGLQLIRWNAHKSYLLDLQHRGVPIVQTTIGRDLTGVDVRGIGRKLGTTEIVIKPTVGANAEFTYPITAGSPDSLLEEVYRIYRKKEYLAQRFMQNVIIEGEFSLFYFNGEQSHAILKKPKEGDFRVQEEHGGSITTVMPEPLLLNAGKRAMDVLPELPLYARVDLVREQNGAFLLMELELIEPALYLRMDKMAAQRFASAIDAWVRTSPTKPLST